MSSFRRRSDLILGAVDVLAVLGAGVVSAAVTGRRASAMFPGAHMGVLIVCAVAVWVIAGSASGMYERAVLRAGWSGAGPAAQTVAVAAASGLILSVVVGNRNVAVLTLVGVTLAGWFALAGRAAVRRGRRALVPFGFGLEQYAVVGTGDAARRLTGDLTRAPGSPFVIGAPISGALPAARVADKARARHLDGVIVPDGLPAEDIAELAGLLAPHGIDLLVEPGGAGRLDLMLSGVAVLHGVPLLRAAAVVPRRPAVRNAPRDRARRGIAILGTRGVPANYGGFETFAERLALHLVDREVNVTVYCRAAYAAGGKSWRGIGLVTLPTIQSKYLDTVVHTFLSAVHLVFTRGPKDVILCNTANAPVLVLLRLAGRRTVLNVDGLEWRRSKWGVAGRSWYRMGEWLSVRFASVLVTDAHEVRTYYRTRHDTDSVMIPYGADLLDRDALPVPPETPGVVRDGYVLYVSRWETENNPVMVARAHARSGVATPLVMLGKATYEDELDRQVRAAAAPHAYLPGAVFGSGYWALQGNARAYVHATEVGGTHPALIEALGAGNLVLVLDTPENREVAGGAARFFRDEDELIEMLCWVDQVGQDELEGWRAKARAHAAATYTWSTVGDSYLDLVGFGRPETPGLFSAPDGPVDPGSALEQPAATGR